MKKSILAIFIFSLLVISTSFYPNLIDAKTKESRKSLIKKLDSKYKNWLDLVEYIITPIEKDVFFKLTSNRDRDTVINLFWNLRDPTKGTPQNEFKDEHIKRFKYANRYFKYGTPLPGWKTDRGRIHILLGPPVSKNQISHKNEFYPVEIWEYYGKANEGLPTVFRVVFYKKYGSGDYELYVPAINGPHSLLRSEIGQSDPTNYYQIYKSLLDVDPVVADVAFRLIPGDPLIDFSPSLQGPILLSKIYDLPKQKIDTTYAKNFLNYRGIVEVSSTTSFIKATYDSYIIKDPLLGFNFIHLALLPERISVDYSGDRDKYYFNFNLMVILKRGEDVIFQHDKDFPFYFTKDELNRKISHGIIIADFIPIIEGKYKLITILQNSINKEISYHERMIESTPSQTKAPRIFGPFVSYQINMSDQLIFSPFQIMGYNIKIDPKRVFGIKDRLSSLFCIDRGNYNKDFQVELVIESLDENRKYLKKYTYEFPDGKSFWCFTNKLEKLRYGNYSIKAKVTGQKGITLVQGEKDFQVSPLSFVPHPPIASKNIKIEDKFFFLSTMALQYQKVKNFVKAETFFQKAFQLNNTSIGLIKNYVLFLFNQKKYDKMLEVIENLKKKEKELFFYYAYKGRALYFKKAYYASINALLEANKIYDSDLSVLNTLGYALIQIGNIKEAIKVLSASLKVNNNQGAILNVINDLKMKKTHK